MLGTSLYCFLSILDPVTAVILIFKHATFLHLSDLSAESALTHAEMDYWLSKIDLKIQEHLVASSYKGSVEQFAHFIMATDIGLFILAPVKIISHQAFTSIISVFCWKECKERPFVWEGLKTCLVKLSYKSIKLSRRDQ